MRVANPAQATAGLGSAHSSNCSSSPVFVRVVTLDTWSISRGIGSRAVATLVEGVVVVGSVEEVSVAAQVLIALGQRTVEEACMIISATSY